MHLYKKLLLIIVIFTPTNLFAEYEININFESGFEFESQKILISDLKNSKSKKQIEKILKRQDWIKDFSIPDPVLAYPFQFLFQCFHQFRY